MKRNRYVLTLVVSFLIMAVYLPAAFSQEDMTELQSEAFAMHERGPARFMHDEHNEKAELEDNCAICHHVYEDGELVEDDSSEGVPCADCHELTTQGTQPGLRLAYHQQCKSCHITQARGPVTCAGCHIASE